MAQVPFLFFRLYFVFSRMNAKGGFYSEKADAFGNIHVHIT